MSRGNESQDGSNRLDRRTLLRATAASGTLAGLAGCASDDGNGGDGDGNGSGDGDGGGGSQETTTVQDVDRTMRSYIYVVPSNIQYNLFNPKNTEYAPNAVLFVWGASLNASTLDWVGIGFDDWSLDGSTFTITANDQMTWHNGDQLTGQDVAATYKLKNLTGQLSSEVNSISADGQTCTIELESAGNPQLVEYNMLSDAGWLQKHGTWEEYIQRIDDASGDEATEQIQADVTSRTIEDPIGCGPFTLQEANARRMVLERYDDYPWSYVQQSHSDATGNDITDWPDRLNFTTLEYLYHGDHNTTAQAIKSGKVDGGTGIAAFADAPLPDGYEELSLPVFWGVGFHYNLWEEGDDAWKDVNVRKAFMHIIDQQAVGVQKNPTEAEIAAETLWTGMGKEAAEEWLSEEFRNSLVEYDQDFDKAASLLEESGYEQRDGQWYKPNGDRLVASFKTGACVTHYPNMIQVANSNLAEFGIKGELSALDCTSFFGKEYREREYELTTPGFWGGSGPHPWHGFSFVYDYSPENYLAAIGPTLEAPPIGQPDSDERIEVDVYARMEELSSDVSEEKEQEIIEELAWITNWNAPKIPTNRQINQAYIPTEGWEYPDTESPALKTGAFGAGFFWAFHAGIVSAEPQ